MFHCLCTYEGMNTCLFDMQGKISLLSSQGTQQLQILIIVLAMFHILSSLVTLALGEAKVFFIHSSLLRTEEAKRLLELVSVSSGFSCILQMKRWKTWEEETTTLEHQLSNGNFTKIIDISLHLQRSLSRLQDFLSTLTSAFWLIIYNVYTWWKTYG